MGRKDDTTDKAMSALFADIPKYGIATAETALTHNNLRRCSRPTTEFIKTQYVAAAGSNAKQALVTALDRWIEARTKQSPNYVAPAVDPISALGLGEQKK